MLDVLPLPILTSYETHKQQKIKVVTVIAVAQSFNMRENGGRLGGIPITKLYHGNNNNNNKIVDYVEN